MPKETPDKVGSAHTARWVLKLNS